MKFKTTWSRGDKTRIAAALGISLQYLSDILSNRRRCSSERAIRLEKACLKLGYRMPRVDWVFPMQRKWNKLFPRKKAAK